MPLKPKIKNKHIQEFPDEYQHFPADFGLGGIGYEPNTRTPACVLSKKAFLAFYPRPFHLNKHFGDILKPPKQGNNFNAEHVREAINYLKGDPVIKDNLGEFPDLLIEPLGPFLLIYNHNQAIVIAPREPPYNGNAKQIEWIKPKEKTPHAQKKKSRLRKKKK